MAPPDVVFALTGDVRRNSRALRQLRALRDAGSTIDVLTLGPPAPDPLLEPGIRLHVLPRPPGGGPRFFAQIHRLFRTAAKAIPARVYHASDLYTLPALASAAHRHRGRLVYDARELYPYVASTAGRPWTTSLWRFVEGRFVGRADVVFTVSESIAAHLSRAYGIPKPTVLYNAPPFQHVTPSDYLRMRTGVESGTALILHQGQMRPDRGCLRLVEAMPKVRGAALVFLGEGPLQPLLRERAVALGLQDRVHFVDAVPPDDLLPVTAGADVGVTLLEDTCLNHRFALPNKLFEYLMAGLPVLASDLPEVRRVVTGYDVGLTVDPADREALAQALQAMVDDTDAREKWSRNIPQVLETFGWERTSMDFFHQYRALL